MFNVKDTLSSYEKASSAQVNWVKSEALLVGQWRDQTVPTLPGGLEWGKEGLKVLGVFCVGLSNKEVRGSEGNSVCSVV